MDKKSTVFTKFSQIRPEFKETSFSMSHGPEVNLYTITIILWMDFMVE